MKDETRAKRIFGKLRKEALDNSRRTPIEILIQSDSNIDPHVETERLFISVFDPNEKYVSFDYSKTAMYLDKILASPGALEKFHKLPKEYRVEIFDQISTMDKRDFLVGAYLEVLEALGNPEPVFLIAREYEIKYFSEAIKKTSAPAFPEQPSKASDEFRKLLIQLIESYRYSNHHTWPIAETILYSLRYLYGEPLMIELLKRSKAEKVVLEVHHFHKIAKNYETFRDYPLSWSLELLSDS